MTRGLCTFGQLFTNFLCRSTWPGAGAVLNPRLVCTVGNNVLLERRVRCFSEGTLLTVVPGATMLCWRIGKHDPMSFLLCVIIHRNGLPQSLNM